MVIDNNPAAMVTFYTSCSCDIIACADTDGETEDLAIHDLPIFENDLFHSTGGLIHLDFTNSLGKHNIDSHTANLLYNHSTRFSVQLAGENPSIAFDQCDFRELLKTLDSMCCFQTQQPTTDNRSTFGDPGINFHSLRVFDHLFQILNRPVHKYTMSIVSRCMTRKEGIRACRQYEDIIGDTVTSLGKNKTILGIDLRHESINMIAEKTGHMRSVPIEGIQIQVRDRSMGYTQSTSARSLTEK